MLGSAGAGFDAIEPVETMFDKIPAASETALAEGVEPPAEPAAAVADVFSGMDFFGAGAMAAPAAGEVPAAGTQ